MGLVGISFEQHKFVLHPSTTMMSHISLLLIVLAVCVYRGLSWSWLQQLQLVLSSKVAIPSSDSDSLPNIVAQKSLKKAVAASVISAGLLLHPSLSFAEVGEAAEIPKVALLTKRSADLQAYSDISRGFKLLRPFGFNEFDGAGGGYLVKFASLFDVDENVVIGSSPASADKTSITDYGSLESIGEKLAKKRGGKVVGAQARETEGIVFYQYEFENPVDNSLPRPKNSRPSKVIELYELCVSKGKLWSIQATSNDKLFPQHEKTLRAALASFIPRL